MTLPSLRHHPDVPAGLNAGSDPSATMSVMQIVRGDGRTGVVSSRNIASPVVAAVCVSRLLTFAAGVAGSLWGGRVAGWTSVDPMRVTSSFGSVGNVLAAPLLRWDGLGYLDIAHHGYAKASVTIFFPAYPGAVAAAGWLVRSDVVAGLLISTISFGIGVWLLHRLTRQELGQRAADAAVLLLAFAPVSLFFTAIYTESLFLALSVGAVYAARNERWWQASVLAAVASITRVTGILLIVPIGLWQVRRYGKLRPGLAWLLLPPAALGGFLAYMDASGYGWLAPFGNQHAHRFAGPFSTIASAVSAAGHGLRATVSGYRAVAPALGGVLSPGFDSLVLLIVLIIAVAALVLVFRRLPVAYGAYALLALLVSVASQTRVQPLESIDRYVLTIFPLWMAAGAWLAERRALKPVVLIGASLLAFYSFEFATWAFVA